MPDREWILKLANGISDGIDPSTEEEHLASVFGTRLKPSSRQASLRASMSLICVLISVK
jgi:tRNA 2-selenouridine synthase SelU